MFAGAMGGLLPTLTLQHLIVGSDRAAAQMIEVFTRDEVEHTDNIAGFYVIKDGLITSAKSTEKAAQTSRTPDDRDDLLRSPKDYRGAALGSPIGRAPHRRRY
ncbi:hypothetical protein [Streptomyces sp. NBC_00388]|uniref:hypothetical protein n=1 Tax=Streptomyces sp. NBC_00388 TaxID=2975735 RepID=UPI002E212EC3